MTDDEIFEWYKTGGKKTDTMSDRDYELYKNQGLTMQSNKLLADNLATQQAATQQARKSAQQSASIANTKLNKYLGQTHLASGLATGQTGTDFINANNAYTQNRAAISNDFMTRQNELMNFYATGKFQNDANAFNTEMSILDKYRDIENTQNTKDYAHAYDMLEKRRDEYLSDNVLSDDEMFVLYSSVEKLPDMGGEKDKLLDMLDYYRSTYGSGSENAKIADTTTIKNAKSFTIPEWSNLREDKTGDNFRLKLGDGKEYDIRSMGKQTDATLINKAAELDVNTVFMYDNKIYVKSPGGDIFLIEGRGSNRYNNAYANLLAELKG